jgi:hypothetical protein
LNFFENLDFLEILKFYYPGFNLPWGNKISKFPKNLNFQKSSKFRFFGNLKIKKKFQNFHRILRKFSKFVYHESDIFLKIGFAEIPYINKGLLVYLSLFNWYGGQYTMGRG